jgi:hypothetical protein
MISKLDETSTELDLFAAKSVPGTMYVGGADTVSEVHSDGAHVSLFEFFHRPLLP